MNRASRGGSGLSGRLAGTYPLAETYHLSHLAEEMSRVTDEVSPLVLGATGLKLPGHPSAVVIDRPTWIRRNVASFGHLVEPATRRIIEQQDDPDQRQPGALLASKLVEAETSAILSVLSRKVLGQYELVLPTGEEGDVVTYVGPNILQMERTHQFNPSEFRFWVALHEMTHRAQFQGVPWLREYFMSLVNELVERSKPEEGRIGRILDEVSDRRRSGRSVIDERGLFGLFASAEQREVIDRVQALMSLLEGHGHVVMDRLGAEHLKSQDRMSRVLKGRRKDKRTAAFFRVTGLEMKMKQYEAGERFISGVEKKAGWDTINLAFRGASSLPTLQEIDLPDEWLKRVA